MHGLVGAPHEKLSIVCLCLVHVIGMIMALRQPKHWKLDGSLQILGNE